MAGADFQELARRVREAREGARLTQAGLAEAAGLHDESVSRVERAAFEPSLSTVVALVDALGVGVDALLGREPLKRPAKEKISPAVRRLADLAGRLPDDALGALLRMAEVLSGLVAKTQPSKGRRPSSR